MRRFCVKAIGWLLLIVGFAGMYIVGKEAINTYVGMSAVAWNTLAYLFIIAVTMYLLGNCLVFDHHTDQGSSNSDTSVT